MEYSSSQHFPNQTTGFNEEEWLRIIFLISDTQAWLNDIQKQIIYQLPIKSNKKFLRKSSYLTVSTLAHIIERHYYKIQRYPGRGKFTIPVVDILEYIRDSLCEAPQPVSGTSHLQRVTDIKKVIGFDKYGQFTSLITVLTDNAGCIVTAFPGTIN